MELIVKMPDPRPCDVYRSGVRTSALLHGFHMGYATVEYKGGMVEIVHADQVRMLDSKSLFDEYEWSRL